MTFTALRTRREPASSPAPVAPVLTTSMACIADGSRPVRKKRRVGSDEVKDVRAEKETGSSWSRVTLYVPDSGVVRPMMPTAEPAVGAEGEAA